MKKKLIEVNNLESYICKAHSRIYADNSMILTPGARDNLSKRKITIIREAQPEFPSCGAVSCPARLCMTGSVVKENCSDADLERLFYGVAAMVKEEYGIDDPEQLQDISNKFVEALKKTL